MKELARRGRRSLAPDLYCLGDSRDPGPATLRAQRRRARALLRARARPRQRSLLVVHDWGGFIGLTWACRNPDRVEAMVLSDTGFFSDGRWHGIAELLRGERGEEAIAAFDKDGFAGSAAGRRRQVQRRRRRRLLAPVREGPRPRGDARVLPRHGLREARAVRGLPGRDRGADAAALGREGHLRAALRRPPLQPRDPRIRPRRRSRAPATSSSRPRPRAVCAWSATSSPGSPPPRIRFMANVGESGGDRGAGPARARGLGRRDERRRAARPARARGPLDHRPGRARRHPARLEHGLQGRLLPARGLRLRPRRHALPAPPRLQHGPPRDHPERGRARAARRRRPGAATASPTCDSIAAHPARGSAATGSSACSTSTRTSTTSASRARASPTGRSSATRPTLPAEPKQGFPANYLGMPALNRAFDHFWANDADAAGRPLQNSFAAMWRHMASRFADRRKVLGYNILNEPWPGIAVLELHLDRGLPGLRHAVPAAVQRAGAGGDPRGRSRDARLVRAAAHLRLRRRHLDRRHRRSATRASPSTCTASPRSSPARRRAPARPATT